MISLYIITLLLAMVIQMKQNLKKSQQLSALVL